MTKRAKLFDIPSENESFEEQMKAMDVEVVKQQPFQKVRRIKTNRHEGRRMKMDLSISKYCINTGREVSEALGGDGTFVELFTAEYQGERVLMMRPSKEQRRKDGSYKIAKSKNSNTHKIGSHHTVNALIKEGLTMGKYMVKRVKGGVIAIRKDGESHAGSTG